MASENTTLHKPPAISRQRLVVYLATAIVIAVVGVVFTRPGLESPTPSTLGVETPAEARAAPVHAAQESVQRIQSATNKAAGDQHGLRPVGTTATKPPSAFPRFAAKVYPEDLVLELSAFVRNGLAEEDGPALTRILNALAAQGEAAIPSIRELLEGGEDIGFDGVEGLDADGTLRLALFDVLRRIGGAEAETVLLGELQSTAGPSEIATLAQFLDELAPGEYGQQAVAAARETLHLSLSDQLTPGNVGPLFQVLHDYGGADVVAELKKTEDKWGYYTKIALGELSGGEGIPELAERVERRLEQSAGIPKSDAVIYADEDLFAVQMLAQVAATQPQAQETLLEQAAAGRIPDVLWPKLTQALAGVYLFQTTRRDVEKMGSRDSESGSYPHVRLGNGQILYIRNRYKADDLSAEERFERVALIDEFLAVTKSPRAIRELEKTRASLLSGQW